MVEVLENIVEAQEEFNLEADCAVFEELVEKGQDPEAVEQSHNKELVVSQSIRIKKRKSSRNKNIHSTKKKLHLEIGEKGILTKMLRANIPKFLRVKMVVRKSEIAIRCVTIK